MEMTWDVFVAFKEGRWTFAENTDAFVVELEKKAHGFSVLFKVCTGEPLSQRIYTLKNPEGQEIALFLVPVERSEESVMMEAVFT